MPCLQVEPVIFQPFYQGCIFVIWWGNMVLFIRHICRFRDYLKDILIRKCQSLYSIYPCICDVVTSVFSQLHRKTAQIKKATVLNIIPSQIDSVISFTSHWFNMDNHIKLCLNGVFYHFFCNMGNSMTIYNR